MDKMMVKGISLIEAIYVIITSPWCKYVIMFLRLLTKLLLFDRLASVSCGSKLTKNKDLPEV